MRTGRDICRKRTRIGSSVSLSAAIEAGSVLALGDEPGGCAQHVTLGAEHRQRGVGAGEQVANALLGAIDAELRDEGGLAERRVLAGRLAERRSVALGVEQVVGDLEGLA